MMLPVSPPAGGRTPLAIYIERLTPRLRGMSRFYARRTGIDADDLLQEAWLGLVRAWRVLNESVGDPNQFLLKHARWRLLSHVRHILRRSMLAIPPDLVRDDQWLSAADLRLDVELLYKVLAPMQRRILTCVCSGMTWRETGDELGCTSPNVAYHMRRIRAHLDDAP